MNIFVHFPRGTAAARRPAELPKGGTGGSREGATRCHSDRASSVFAPVTYVADWDTKLCPALRPGDATTSGGFESTFYTNAGLWRSGGVFEADKYITVNDELNNRIPIYIDSVKKRYSRDSGLASWTWSFCKVQWFRPFWHIEINLYTTYNLYVFIISTYFL